MTLKIRPAHVFLLVSMGLFALSLTQPVFVCHYKGLSWKGLEVLVLGWLALISLDPRWFANAALAYLWWWLLGPAARPFPLKSSVFILLAALSAPLIPSPVGCPGMDTPTAASALAAGGYLWSAALVVAVIGAFVARDLKRLADS